MDQTLCLRGANFKVHWTLDRGRAPHERATWEGKGPARSYARTEYRAGTRRRTAARTSSTRTSSRPRRPARHGRQRCWSAACPSARPTSLTAATQSTCWKRALTVTLQSVHMADFLEEKRKEIQARLKSCKPLVEEYHRLEAAEQALAGVDSAAPARARHRRRAPLHRRARPRSPERSGTGQARPPQGQRHPRRAGARARAPSGPASPSPSWPRRWASSRTTSTASCPASPRRARSPSPAGAGTRRSRATRRGAAAAVGRRGESQNRLVTGWARSRVRLPWRVAATAVGVVDGVPKCRDSVSHPSRDSPRRANPPTSKPVLTCVLPRPRSARGP